ncbi:unnamed protein product [Alternaria alternata]
MSKHAELVAGAFDVFLTSRPLYTFKTDCFTPADFNAIAQQFVEFYYKTFDGNRAGLGALYVCDSDETQMREKQQMADK